jgi:hypothetical protein
MLAFMVAYDPTRRYVRVGHGRAFNPALVIAVGISLNQILGGTRSSEA